MTLRDYLTMLRRGWWVVAAATLLGVGLATVATFMTAPTYSAASAVILTATDNGMTYGPAREHGFAVGWANTYAALASTDVVVDRAAASINDDTNKLRDSISATARSDTAIIDITATASDPQLAAQRADAVADTLV